MPLMIPVAESLIVPSRSNSTASGSSIVAVCPRRPGRSQYDPATAIDASEVAMSDAVSSDVIEALADNLSAFAEGLSIDERDVLDRFFLQQGDDGEDVLAFGMELDAVRAAKQHRIDQLQELESDPPARRRRYEAVL